MRIRRFGVIPSISHIGIFIAHIIIFCWVNIRDRQTEAGIVIGESLFLLTRNPQWLMSIMETIPALKELGTKLSGNYEPLYHHDKDILMFVVNMNYKVDIASYFVYLNDNGLDTSDPCKIADIVKVYDSYTKLTH